MSNYHIPVMLKEVISYLNIQKGAWYIDCTLGGGGHTEEIIKAGGKVLGIDSDCDAIKEVAQNYHLIVKFIDGRLQVVSKSLIIYQANFVGIKDISTKLLQQQPQGILFDLGVSSYQLNRSTRGFSFHSNAPLDMRMDRSQKLMAADLVNGLYESELAQLFWKYGEEPLAKSIARKIVEYRNHDKIDSTEKLVQIILSIKKMDKTQKIHPATKIFQALRIAVNDELYSLKRALPQALEILRPGGRLIIISFHSLEDRIVKNFFKDEQQKCSIKILTQKPIEPTEEEIYANPKSRSAKLRIAEKF